MKSNSMKGLSTEERNEEDKQIKINNFESIVSKNNNLGQSKE